MNVPLISVLLFFFAKTHLIWFSLLLGLVTALAIARMSKNGMPSEGSPIFPVLVISYILAVLCLIVFCVGLVYQGSEFFQILGLLFV